MRGKHFRQGMRECDQRIWILESTDANSPHPTSQLHACIIFLPSFFGLLVVSSWIDNCLRLQLASFRESFFSGHSDSHNF